MFDALAETPSPRRRRRGGHDRDPRSVALRRRPRARSVLRLPREHAPEGARRGHPDPPLRGLGHRRGPHQRDDAPPPPGALRRRRARLHPHREPVGVVLPERHRPQRVRRLEREQAHRPVARRPRLRPRRRQLPHERIGDRVFLHARRGGLRAQGVALRPLLPGAATGGDRAPQRDGAPAREALDPRRPTRRPRA